MKIKLLLCILFFATFNNAVARSIPIKTYIIDYTAPNMNVNYEQAKQYFSMTLDWSAVYGATHFKIQYGKPGEPLTKLDIDNTSPGKQLLTTLNKLQDGTYIFYVDFHYDNNKTPSQNSLIILSKAAMTDTDDTTEPDTSTDPDQTPVPDSGQPGQSTDTDDVTDTTTPDEPTDQTTPADDSNDPAPPTPAAPQVQISWSTPTLREDNSPLDQQEITAFEIYHTANIGSSNETGEVVAINDPSQTSLVLENLSPGEHHFAIAVIDSYGLKSQMSNLASITIGSDGSIVSIETDSSEHTFSQLTDAVTEQLSSRSTDTVPKQPVGISPTQETPA